MTNAILRGKPDAGNPHVRFDEGEVASAKPRRGSLLYKKVIRTYKTCELYTKLYGRAAYEAWRAREAEIDALMRRGVSRRDVVAMREDNFRKMKAAGESVAAGRVAHGTLGKVLAAA